LTLLINFLIADVSDSLPAIRVARETEGCFPFSFSRKKQPLFFAQKSSLDRASFLSSLLRAGDYLFNATAGRSRHRRADT